MPFTLTELYIQDPAAHEMVLQLGSREGYDELIALAVAGLTWTASSRRAKS